MSKKYSLIWNTSYVEIEMGWWDGGGITGLPLGGGVGAAGAGNAS